MSAAELREALARVVSDQRRDPDLIVDDVFAVLREHGRVGYEIQWDDGVSYGEHYVHFNGAARHDGRVLVLPMPDKEAT